MALIDLRDRLGEPEIRALIEIGTGSPASAGRAIARYRSRDWLLLGYVEGGLVIGCIGVEQADAVVVLHSLAVEPGHRRRGIGRAMTQEIATTFPYSPLEAETDAEAVIFYRRCGFDVESLGEKYPGLERFRCTTPAMAGV